MGQGMAVSCTASKQSADLVVAGGVKDGDGGKWRVMVVMMVVVEVEVEVDVDVDVDVTMEQSALSVVAEMGGRGVNIDGAVSVEGLVS